jgi:predicted permease
MIQRLLRLALRLTPREFRDRFGPEMLETARRVDVDRPRRLGQIARAVLDALVTPFAVHRDLRRDARSSLPARTPLMSSLLQDIQFAFRGLRREPGFTLFVCVALALGIGANAAMFGIADRLLLSGPAHVRDADRVVRLHSVNVVDGQARTHNPSFGYVTYDLLAQQAWSLSDIATWAVNDALVGRRDEARPIRLGYASAGLFPLLGVRPALGRFYSEQEDSTADAEPLLVLSEHAWQSWFGGARDVLGRSVVIDDEALTVIGVAPRGFTGPQFGPVDAWVPMNRLNPRVTPDFRTAWTAQWLQIVGRLAPGATADQAAGEATRVFRQGYDGPRPLPDGVRIRTASLRAAEFDVSPNEIRLLTWLAAVAVVILLVACANVANLLLTRGVRRGREVAVRAALGAGRLRLVRLLLLESALLAAASGALGLLVANLIGGAARRLLFSSVDWTGSVVDTRVVLVAVAIAAATALLTGLLPAIRASCAALNDALKTGVAAGATRSRLRTALTIVQAALSVVLLIGAGLFGRSLWNIHQLDLGIDADRVLVFELRWPGLGTLPEGDARESERARRKTFYLDELARVRAIPGVEHASVAIGMPFGYGFRLPMRVAGIAELPRLGSDYPSISAVGPGYFETVGTSIIRGRSFDDTDGAGGPSPIAGISRVLAADDPAVTYVRVQTVQERVDPQIRPWRQAVAIFVASGVLALVVAGIGVYSVVSYLVADRRREIGVRLALGARPGDVTRLVLRASLTTAVVGEVLGGAIAAGAGVFIEPALFETSPRDPFVYAGAAGLLMTVAVVASLAPARRARTVSPIEVLRTE